MGSLKQDLILYRNHSHLSMTVLNAFQTLVPKAEPKDYQGIRKKGYVIGSNGKFVPGDGPSLNSQVNFNPPLTEAQRYDRDIKNSSFRAAENAPTRRSVAKNRINREEFNDL